MHAQKAVGQCTLRKPSGRVGAGLSMQMSRGLLKPELAPARATGAIADSEWPLSLRRRRPGGPRVGVWRRAGRLLLLPLLLILGGCGRGVRSRERCVWVVAGRRERRVDVQVAGKRARRGCAGCG